MQRWGYGGIKRPSKSRMRRCRCPMHAWLPHLCPILRALSGLIVNTVHPAHKLASHQPHPPSTTWRNVAQPCPSAGAQSQATEHFKIHDAPCQHCTLAEAQRRPAVREAGHHTHCHSSNGLRREAGMGPHNCAGMPVSSQSIGLLLGPGHCAGASQSPAGPPAIAASPVAWPRPAAAPASAPSALAASLPSAALVA